MTTATNPRTVRPAALAGLATVAFALAGCGAGTGELSGTVTHKGKPVASGSVTVVGPDGMPRGAAIGPDGQYALGGLSVGEVKITVTSPNPATIGAPTRRIGTRGADRAKVGRKVPTEPPSPDQEIVKKWFPIPESYGDIAKTTLRATVKRGSTTHDIDLP